MCTNASFNCFDLDCIRLGATQNWSSTLQRTYHIDVDIVDLARGEACRRYKDLESRAKFLLPPTLEEVREAIEAWAFWQALELRAARQDSTVGPDGMYTFIQDLEQTLERLTTRAVEDRFIL